MNINENEARLIFQMGQHTYDCGSLTKDMLDFIQKLAANMCTIDVSKWDYIYNADQKKMKEQ
jgi:hypothetical protein